MIPFPYNQKLITCLATTLSCELLRQLLVKIENICVFKIYYNKKHGNVFKNWLCPSFLLLPKKSELPKLWGGCSPPRPPGPYAYALDSHQFILKIPLTPSPDGILPLITKHLLKLKDTANDLNARRLEAQGSSKK